MSARKAFLRKVAVEMRDKTSLEKADDAFMVAAPGVLAAVVSPGQAREAFDRATGWQTAWHGTNPENAESIKSIGLDPLQGGRKGGGGSLDTTSSSKAPLWFSETSKGKVHITTRKGIARAYARLKDSDGNLIMAYRMGLNPFSQRTRKGVFAVGFPYEEFVERFREDPGFAMDRAINDRPPSEFASNQAVIPDELGRSPAFLKRRARALKNLGKYLKENPKRAASALKPLGVAALFPALAALGWMNARESKVTVED